MGFHLGACSHIKVLFALEFLFLFDSPQEHSHDSHRLNSFGSEYDSSFIQIGVQPASHFLFLPYYWYFVYHEFIMGYSDV